MEGKAIKLTGFVLPLAIWLAPVICALPALAADPKKKEDPSEIAIVHTPPAFAEPVSPGKEITLTVRLRNTKKFDLQMRAMVVWDGRLMELPLSRAYPNEYDVPVYEFKLPEPLLEMSYRFLLYKGVGLPEVSQRYMIRRNCLPQVDLVDLSPEAEADTDSRKQFEELINKARGLEQDLANYERALETLRAIRTFVPG